MKQYHDLLRMVLDEGRLKKNRTGVDTYSVFGAQARYRLSEGFPLLTTKKIHFRSVAYELLWFIRGDTNIRYLNENGVRIWDEWADESGDLGPIYGRQWRSWPDLDGGTIDQLVRVVERIKTNPDCRRLIVSSWNVAELDQMRLAPCHCLFQFNVRNGKLNCQLYQRSCDLFLGVPFNMASYALLTHMVAHVCGLAPGDFIHTFGDLHIYVNHMEQVEEQLSREPRPLPQLLLNHDVDDICGFDYDDIVVLGYNPHPPISAEVAV